MLLIKKKSGKQELFIDLQNANATVVALAPLPPGLPSLTQFLKIGNLMCYTISIIFLSIKLSVPNFLFLFWLIITRNNVNATNGDLPERMTNLPAMNQYLVVRAIDPFHKASPCVDLVYQMDDILLPAASAGVLQQAYALLQGNLQQPVLVIAPGKVQKKRYDGLFRTCGRKTNHQTP